MGLETTLENMLNHGTKTSLLFVVGLLIAYLSMTVRTYWQVKITCKSLFKWAIFNIFFCCSGIQFELVIVLFCSRCEKCTEGFICTSMIVQTKYFISFSFIRINDNEMKLFGCKVATSANITINFFSTHQPSS